LKCSSVTTGSNLGLFEGGERGLVITSNRNPQLYTAGGHLNGQGSCRGARWSAVRHWQGSQLEKKWVQRRVQAEVVQVLLPQDK